MIQFLGSLIFSSCPCHQAFGYFISQSHCLRMPMGVKKCQGVNQISQVNCLTRSLMELILLLIKLKVLESWLLYFSFRCQIAWGRTVHFCVANSRVTHPNQALNRCCLSDCWIRFMICIFLFAVSTKNKVGFVLSATNSSSPPQSSSHSHLPLFKLNLSFHSRLATWR